MAGFVQIIEFRTSQIDEVLDFAQQRRELIRGALVRGSVTADLDRPGMYFNVLEFQSSRQDAVLADLAVFAREFAKLCDGPPKTYNLDPLETWWA